MQVGMLHGLLVWKRPPWHDWGLDLIYANAGHVEGRSPPDVLFTVSGRVINITTTRV